MNILNNAQQAIESRGMISITTRIEGKKASVAIRDSGCGISEEVRSRIFDPFFTTKAPGVGTGLGLSLSYGIISRLGGSIECRSQPGAGSEFVVTFPFESENDPTRSHAAVAAIHSVESAARGPDA
jgi:signal transduction histidine kinase